MSLPLFLWLVLACTTSTTTIPYDPTCTVAIAVEGDNAVRPGDVVTLIGTPFTRAPDTAIRLDGAAAAVTEVVREGCDECDTCEAATCLPCTSCPDCDAVCTACVERVRFVVPAVAVGDRPVVLVNAYGASDPAFLLVYPADTDDTDDTDR